MPLDRTRATVRFFTALRPLRGANDRSARLICSRSTLKWRRYENCNPKEKTHFKAKALFPSTHLFRTELCGARLLQARNYLRQEARVRNISAGPRARFCFFSPVFATS